MVTQDLPRIRAFIQDHGLLGLALSVPVYTAIGATIVPSEPLTLFITDLYGPLLAALTASLGNLGAAVLDYLIGMRIGAAADIQNRKARLPFGLGRLPVTSPVFLICGRMLPGYGAKLIGLLCGALRVHFGLFLWTSAVQTVLGAFTFAFGGWGLLALLK